jgi:hypothetical protein
MGSEQEGLTEIILWSNPDQVMVEEDHFMVELTVKQGSFLHILLNWRRLSILNGPKWR